jgi:enamine deaminase RidA (YjgF/YER057c/UK114 family)
LVPGGIKAEAEQMMLNIKAALARRGLTMKHVVKCTVFLADIAEWERVQRSLQAARFTALPGTYCCGSSGLLASARVEMECIAGYPE